MGIYKSRQYALFLGLMLMVYPLLRSYWKITILSPSCASIPVCISAGDNFKYQPPPARIMVGLAVLAVPILISTASYFDTAKAAPVASIDVADVGIKASPGCAVNSPAALDTTVNVILGDRRYLLYFPVNYQPDKPAPLVLSYHGATRTAESQQALDLLSTPYFNEDYIIVYPNGVDTTWQGAPNVTTNDVAFTAAILDELEGQYCIDSNRIYATGKSQGGGFASVLACDPNMSRRIAAFSPVAGAFYQAGAVCDANAVEIACNPGRTNIPIIDFHGLADTTIAYNGGARRGACLPAIPYYCRYWAQHDELVLVNTTSSVPGALPNSTAVRYEWGSGDSQGLVTHVMSGTEVNHDWPSTQPNSDNLTRGSRPASFNASSVILDFFARHPLRLE